MRYIFCLVLWTGLLLSGAHAQFKPDTLIKVTNMEYAYPFWSPDGTQIVYQSNVTGNNEIYLMNEDGSNIRQLTRNNSDDITPSFSPNGKKIAFVSDRDGDEDIFIMNLEGEIIDKVTFNNHRDIHPYWSPDGSKIIFNSGPTEPEFEIVEVILEDDHRTPRKLTNNDRFDSYGSWSPDGKHIAYVTWFENEDGSSNGEIILADAEGNTLKQLTDNSVFDGWPTWSYDGTHVIFATADMERRTFDLNQVNIKTGEITNLTRVQGQDARANMSSDGSKIVFNREIDDTIDIFTMQSSNPDSISKITNMEFAYPYWSPDGTQIVYQSNVTGNWEIFIMNEEGTDIQQLTHNDSDDITPTWSLDGKYIAFVSDRDGDWDVYIMNLNGEIVDKVTHNTGIDLHPNWSPDSRKIIFSSGPTEPESDIYEVDLQGDRTSKQLTQNDRFDSFASYSPDGLRFAYLEWFPNPGGRFSNAELFMRDVDGSNRIRLTNNNTFDGWLSWHPDGRHIVYSYYNLETNRYDMNWVNVDTKEIIPLTKNNEEHDQRPVVSKDGKKLVFNRLRDGTVEMFIMKLK